MRFCAFFQIPTNSSSRSELLKLKSLFSILTCSAAKRQQVWAPRRKLLTKVHVGLKGQWGYEKNWK